MVLHWYFACFLLQVKDILYHLYMTARGNLQRLMPKEIRILKYLLMIEDPEERDSALNDAFTPGEELQGKDVDFLFTYVDMTSHLLTKQLQISMVQLLRCRLVREIKDYHIPLFYCL